jgi:MATE family multidrug resistance protein
VEEGRVEPTTALPGIDPDADLHPFVSRPHRTLVGLTVPVLLSLVVEPITGVVDTAFVARLGAAPAAALGVGVSILSSLFWVFNFIGIGTQTELARLAGAGRREEQRATTGRALSLAAVLGLLLALCAWPFLEPVARLMGAQGAVQQDAVGYLAVRLLGAPAVLLTMAGAGALRGLQDMRSPLIVAIVVNVLNLLLDPILIFGLGPVPPLGLVGAAWATTASHWLGAAVSLGFVHLRTGRLTRPSLRGARRLLHAGRDIVLRTGALLLFVVLATRTATLAGPEAGAAHQGIRQVWLLTAFLLDAWAFSAQSLVGFFLGAGRPDQARRVAGLACGWGLASGVILTALCLVGREGVGLLLVPADARALFRTAWLPAALSLPLNALGFATDGIHFGTGDYRFLRNAMLLSTALGAAALLGIDPAAASALCWIWIVTLGWNAVRAGFGVTRVWPGIGRAPLRQRAPGGVRENPI